MRKNEDQVYVRLQQHLDRQAVGFPATKSGVEIRILKHIFTPREAEIAICLSYKFEPVQTLFERVGNLVGSPEELEAVLEEIHKKGGIPLRIKDGKKEYRNVPFIIGMLEMQAGRLTPEFLSDVDEFFQAPEFGVETLAVELPQMRTIPVGKSIRPENHVSTFDQISALVQNAEGPFAVMDCICRKKSAMQGRPCKVTDRIESCLAFGEMAASAIMTGNWKEITREEAMANMEQSQKEGLVLQPSNTQHADFICSCCGCCCGNLSVHKMLPRPLEFWATNFNAVVDTDLCNGCGACAKRCQVDAVKVAAKEEPAVVDLNRCIGCGLCVAVCPQKAISLMEKQAEVVPPKTREELYDIIMDHKKGELEKLKILEKMKP